MGNKNLEKAKSAKNNEYYTPMSEIEHELKAYQDKFAGKIVFCNCDDFFESNFSKYFLTNFNKLGLKELFVSGYRILNKGSFMSEKPYAMHVVSTKSVLEHQKSDMSLADLARFIKQGEGVELIPLCGNYGDNNGESVFFEAGDFRSSMSLSMLESADIVVSNPPFSLIKAYIMQLDAFKNEFLIVGNKNAITYKGIFPLFMQDKIWLGEGSMNGGRWMMVPDGIELISQHYKRDAEGKRLINIPGVCWFTNLDHKKRHQQLPLDLNCTYLGHEELYPKYDNYDAIEVDRVSRIPHDYNGVMGVPITFLDKYCPTQFKIVGASESEGVGLSNGLWDSSSKISQPVVYGKRKYKRLFIERC